MTLTENLWWSKAWYIRRVHLSGMLRVYIHNHLSQLRLGAQRNQSAQRTLLIAGHIQVQLLQFCLQETMENTSIFSPFSIGEERAGLCVSRVFVCLFSTRWVLSFFSSSWCQGLAAACDCDTPWTFLLTVVVFFILQITRTTPANLVW